MEHEVIIYLCPSFGNNTVKFEHKKIISISFIAQELPSQIPHSLLLLVGPQLPLE